MKILRQSIEVVDYQALTLPNPTRILSVAPVRDGGERIDVWFIDYEELAETRLKVMRAGRQSTVDIGVYIAGTGNPMPEILGHPIGDDLVTFEGTCVMPSGLVWHVFTAPVVRP